MDTRYRQSHRYFEKVSILCPALLITIIAAIQRCKSTNFLNHLLDLEVSQFFLSSNIQIDKLQHYTFLRKQKYLVPSFKVNEKSLILPFKN